MVSLSNHVAISLRLNTRRRTIIATATRLPPPYQVRGRNDKVGTRERRQGLFTVLRPPLVLSLSKDGRRWFDRLTMSGWFGWLISTTFKRLCIAGAPDPPLQRRV